MPIYEYECSKCNKVVEVFKNMNDGTDVFCPDCNKVMDKLISQSSFYIKGYAPSKAFKNANELRRKNEKHEAEQKKKN